MRGFCNRCENIIFDWVDEDDEDEVGFPIVCCKAIPTKSQLGKYTKKGEPQKYYVLRVKRVPGEEPKIKRPSRCPKLKGKKNK